MYLAYLKLPAKHEFALLGIAVAAGGIVHTLGDMITKAGCPVLFPIPLGRRLWRDIGVPDFMAVKVGGKFEVRFLRPALFLVGTAAAVVIATGSVLFDLRN